MFWFDLVTPKSVLFFKNIIFELEKRGYPIVVTTRYADDYREVAELLDLYNMKFYTIGEFGGGDVLNKYKASLDRQQKLLDFIKDKDIKLLISLCSVDANRLAFGIKLPIINFYDIPLSDYKANFKKALPQARLTLPLSSFVFKPFVVPNDIFLRFSLEKDQIYTYNFLDPLIWLVGFEPDKSYYINILKSLGADPSKPTIIIREEEYKSSYVDKKYPFLYEAIKELYKEIDVNFIIIPRYEVNYLKKEFPFAYILEKRVVIQHLLAFSSLFIGGGGTINIEATYFGIPTISTRSFISHYDNYLIENDMMIWVSSKEELKKKVKGLLGKDFKEKAKKFYSKMEVNTLDIVNKIIEVYKTLE